jgi:hypothetical protein
MENDKKALTRNGDPSPCFALRNPLSRKGRGNDNYNSKNKKENGIEGFCAYASLHAE